MLHQTVSNGQKAKNSKWKYVPSQGIEPAVPSFPACRSKHSAIETANDIMLKRLHYFLRYLSINTCGTACMKLILIRCVLEPRASEKGISGTRVPHFQKFGAQVGLCPHFSSPCYAAGSCLSDKNWISFTINRCYIWLFTELSIVWTNQTIINFINALSHVLIDSTVKR